MSDAIEGATSPPFGKDGQSSPMMDKRKKTRKKSMNQKGDTAIGQAEGELWGLLLYISARLFCTIYVYLLLLLFSFSSSPACLG
jgi:hypothetical protein